jgi:hypothetical protein
MTPAGGAAEGGGEDACEPPKGEPPPFRAGRRSECSRRRIPGLLVYLGLALPSKDVDLFIEEFNPLELSRLIAEALGLLEERFEFFRRGDNQIFHFFAKVERGVVAVEVMSRTQGKI